MNETEIHVNILSVHPLLNVKILIQMYIILSL